VTTDGKKETSRNLCSYLSLISTSTSWGDGFTYWEMETKIYRRLHGETATLGE
jgi:hypothetical protein